jgi:hypothetical protein
MTHERTLIAGTARAGLALADAQHVLAVGAISTLENYGDHHDWCAAAAPANPGLPCTCGFLGQLLRLRAERDKWEAPDVPVG